MMQYNGMIFIYITSCTEFIRGDYGGFQTVPCQCDVPGAMSGVIINFGGWPSGCYPALVTVNEPQSGRTAGQAGISVASSQR